MKTLYVSDLDGTLLRSDERTSEYTNGVINSLVEKGLLFTYATARSYFTSHKVTEGMTAAFPLILYNGAFIMNNRTGEMMLESFFVKSEAETLIKEMTGCGVYPLVYSFIDGKEKYSYIWDKISYAEKSFVKTRQDLRSRAAENIDELLCGDIFYLTLIDAPEKLRPFYEKYKDTFRCVYQRDIYSGEQWLETMPKEVSKANAVKRLAGLLGCQRIVAFGDGLNDIDMFKIADEAYAVENAADELKRAATAVIGPNDEDAVAKWLYEYSGLADADPE